MKLNTLVAGSLLAATSAFADTSTLIDFEAPASFESIGSFYDSVVNQVPLLAQVVDEAYQNHPIENGDSCQGNKADTC